MKVIATFNSFSGQVIYYQHSSSVTDCIMTFSVYLPKQSINQKVPAVIWLSGLTCNHENFITKAAAQRYADQHGLILIMPDTSPRDVGIEAADVDYDLGYGAGFYLNATEKPWSEHFCMYDYILDELIPLCCKTLPVNPEKMSIMGHSMGGHGAIVLGLRNPDRFQSISAFSPICHPMKAPWGQKAFTAYLGEDQAAWAQYDSCELIKESEQALPLLVDQGSSDQFLKEQLMPECLIKTAEQNNYPLTFNYREGFDHSYYFIATFIADHLAFHASHVN